MNSRNEFLNYYIKLGNENPYFFARNNNVVLVDNYSLKNNKKCKIIILLNFDKKS